MVSLKTKISWNTNDTISSSLGEAIFLMSTPPIRISPEETSQKRGIRLAIVDFPEPDGPTKAVISPCLAMKETFFKASFRVRSEEHTSELQSRQYLVCRLLLEKKI